MLLPFDKLPDHSRIWIYQSSRPLNSTEVSIISDELSAFTNEWSAHGIPLSASFDIRFNQFVILGADQHQQEASGCSIDDSVRKVKDIEAKFANVDLFDRRRVAFLINNEVTTIRMEDLKKEFNNGTWHGGTLVFNNVINKKGDLSREWLVPAEITWLKRYLPSETIAR